MEAVYRTRSASVRDSEVYATHPGSVSREYKNSRLVRRAWQLGRFAGQAVTLARQARELIHDMRLRVREQGGELSAEVLARTRKLGEEATGANALREKGGNKAAELGWRVRNTAARTLQRGRSAMHEHPARAVLAAGIVGLVAGTALRLGRSHRAQ